jgi:hypothetical protein
MRFKIFVTTGFFCLFVVSSALAFNPENFLQVFGGNGMHQNSLTKLLGYSPGVESGDAGTGMFAHFYATANKKEMIKFFTMECSDGFTVSKVDEKKMYAIKILPRNITKIKVQGLQLGMPRKAVKSLFALGKVENDYKGSKRDVNSSLLIYDYWKKETVMNKNGESMDTYSDIHFMLLFDQTDKLIKFVVESENCADSPGSESETAIVDEADTLDAPELQ